MAALVLSALCGFAAKLKALMCEFYLQATIRAQELSAPVFKEHERSEEAILELAGKHGIEIETEIDPVRVYRELTNPLPWWFKIGLKKKLENFEPDRLETDRKAFTLWVSQVNWTIFQSGFFILFMLTGAWYAGDI